MKSLDLSNLDERRLYDGKVEVLMRLAQDGLVLISEWRQLAPDDASQDSRRNDYQKLLDVPSLGALNNIKEQVTERLNAYQRWVTEARDFYDQGDSTSSLSRIELIESTYGNLAEVGDLKQKALEADRFVNWMNGFSNKIGSMSVSAVCSDSGLLEWFKHKLPEVYWHNTGESLLNWADKQVSEANLDAFLRIDNLQYDAISAKLVEFIAATRLNRNLRRLSNDLTRPEASMTSTEEELIRFIDKVFALPIAKRISQHGGLLEMIQSLTPDQPVSGRSLVSGLRKRSENRKRMKIILPIALISIILVALLVAFFTGVGPFKEIKEKIFGTTEITPDPTVEVTITMTPKPIPTETPASTLTHTPTLTFTPTATEGPKSKFAYKEEIIIPKLPDGITPKYLIDSNDMIFEGLPWANYNDTDAVDAVGSSLYSVASKSGSKAVFAMDIGIEHQVYIMCFIVIQKANTVVLVIRLTFKSLSMIC